MMEMMKTLMQGNGTYKAPTQTPTPSNTGGGNDTGGGGRNSSRCEGKKHCPHCKWMAYHKPEKCFELEANAAKRPAGWKSVKES
jgi:hypothetical protein